MAIYHLNARGIAPARGSSAVASAAYQSGETLRDEATGELKRYARAERIADTGIVLPKVRPPGTVRVSGTRHGAHMTAATNSWPSAMSSPFPASSTWTSNAPAFSISATCSKTRPAIGQYMIRATVIPTPTCS